MNPPRSQHDLPRGRPLIYGEVLFDHFPDDHRVLGGAPFNVAWNLRGLGADPLFVSAIGEDSAGEEILERMQNWEMDCRGVTVLPSAPTGRVSVSFDGGEPTYEIVADQAYDRLELDPAVLFGKETFRPADMGLIYHGSLAWRSEASRTSLQRLRRSLECPVFVDINIREPWFEESWLDELLGGVRWLKLNLSELGRLAGLELPVNASTGAVADAAGVIRRRFRIPHLIVTAGQRGAWWLGETTPPIGVAATSVGKSGDTVGAGDAFAAVCLLGLLKSWDIRTLLDRAAVFAGQVCNLRGATTARTDFYRLPVNSDISE